MRKYNIKYSDYDRFLLLNNNMHKLGINSIDIIVENDNYKNGKRLYELNRKLIKLKNNLKKI